MKRLLALAGASAFILFMSLGGSAAAAPNAGGCQLHGTASGTVFAGTNGLPAATGNGSCGSSTTSGIAVVQWSDGTATVVQYSTTGAAAAVSLKGSVIASVTSSTGTTYTTTRYAGDTALGALAFEPPDPTACAGAGVTSAGIDGTVDLGSS